MKLLNFTFSDRIRKAFSLETSINIGTSSMSGVLDIRGIDKKLSSDVVKKNLLKGCLSYGDVILNKKWLKESVNLLQSSIDTSNSIIDFVGYDLDEKCFILVCLCNYDDNQMFLWIPLEDDKIKLIRREPVAKGKRVKGRFIDLMEIFKEGSND